MKDRYSTRDVYFAAALLVYGYVLCEVNRTDIRHQKFYFEGDKRRLRGLEVEYANRKLVVEVTAYKEALQRLKSLIHMDK